MDLIKLMDELEQVVVGSSKIPMTNKVLIDVELVLEYLDKVRSALPEELRQARWLSKERERLIQDAREEAERALSLAKTEVEKMVQDNEVARQASSRAEEILNQAKTVARDIVEGANEYAETVLRDLEGNLEKTLTVVKKGRQELQRARSKSAS
ncbi:MAG: ATPase [Bacillota bacterium]